MKPVAQKEYSPSSGQRGAAAEVLTAARIMMDSKGRLACYVPMVDDDAVDLLVLDKRTERTLGLQVKSRILPESGRSQTVQFDIRIPTWRDSERLYLLAVALDRHCCQIETAWFIPSGKVVEIAPHKGKTMSLCPNPKPTSKDKYSDFRLHNMKDVVGGIIRAIEKSGSS